MHVLKPDRYRPTEKDYKINLSFEKVDSSLQLQQKIISPLQII